MARALSGTLGSVETDDFLPPVAPDWRVVWMDTRRQRFRLLEDTE